MTQASAGTLERLAEFVGKALAPLAEELQQSGLVPFARRLGVVLPDELASNSNLNSAVNTTVTTVTELADGLPELASSLSNLDLDDIGTIEPVVTKGAATVSSIVESISAITEMAEAARDNLAPLPAELVELVDEMLSALPIRIIEYLVLEHIDRRVPAVSDMLPLFGLVEDVELPGDPGLRIPPYRHRRLHLNRFINALTDPQSWLRETFRFGMDDFDGSELYQPIIKLLKDREFPVLLLEPPGAPPVLEAFLIRLQADTSINPPGLHAVLRAPGGRDFNKQTALGGVWAFETNADVSFEAGLEALLTSDGGVSLSTPTAAGSLTVSAGLLASTVNPSERMTILGITGASRLTLERFQASAGISANWSGSSVSAEPVIEIALNKLRAEIDLGGGDSFLQDISGGGKGGADVSVGAIWSPSTGMRFSGSSALEINIPTHASIGPAALESVFLVASVDAGSDNPRMPLEISGTIKGDLGPAKAVVERVGVKLVFSAPDEGGNLGPLQLDAAFKAPTGIGLSLDGGGIKGGGFLRFDPQRGEYAGTLELKFQGAVHLKAIGVLNTIMPDGSDGFSLMVLITAEFTPLQLGFGFTLNGVGGLVGVNRTMMLGVLSAGVRDGTLQSVLFPDDVVANAPAIIADLQSVFPPRQGRFIVGPMAKLGWGTPTLVSLELGIIVEIPRPAFAVVGILTLALPDPTINILEINVAFVGTVDFEKKQLTFDASLFDSRVLTFTLTGDMAVRIFWGDKANFLLTVGGFHPAYSPPPMGLPDIRRLAINILTGNPRLTASSYFAITSNTVQFGGKIEAYAGSGIFNVYGFVSLDALIQFNPFEFIAELSAMVAARSGSTVLFSVRLTFTLSGPTPWRAVGKASFSISLLFFDIDISIRFSVTVGEERSTTLPPVRVLDELVLVLQNRDNWRALPPSNASLLVTLRDIGDQGPAVVHPFGMLAVNQKIVPLNTPIERFGARNLSGGNRLSLTDLTVGGVEVDARDTQEEFATAQFVNLSDAEKLSLPSFSAYDSGVESTTTALAQATFQRRVEIEHELTYIDRPLPPIRHRLSDILIAVYLEANATAQSPLAAATRAPTGLGTPAVAVVEPEYVLTDTVTLEVAEQGSGFATEAQALSALRETQRTNPAMAERLQVMAAHELAA